MLQLNLLFLSPVQLGAYAPLVCQEEEEQEDNKMDALSEEIGRYPHLYHLSLKEYKDSQMVSKSWQELNKRYQ